MGMVTNDVTRSDDSGPDSMLEVKKLYTTTTHQHYLPSTHTNLISALYKLLLTLCLPNFKGRFMGSSWRDSNCHNDICPGNICPYQEYQLLLTQFWPNFKGMFLNPSLTDANCHSDICPTNICPEDICPYQEYISCYCTDLDETLKVGSWKHLEHIPTVREPFVQATFVLATIVHIRNISAVTDSVLTKL